MPGGKQEYLKRMGKQGKDSMKFNKLPKHSFLRPMLKKLK